MMSGSIVAVAREPRRIVDSVSTGAWGEEESLVDEDMSK